MTKHKFQISNKSQKTNLKSQRIKSLHLSLINFILAEFTPKNPSTARQNLFGSLELGIWILLDICYLMLGIFYIQQGIHLLLDVRR
jgi:hypothetical protein